MKSKYLLLMVMQFAIITSYAQKKIEWKTASSGGYTYKYVTNDPLKARFYTLKNGLTVILSENHKEPRIQTLIPVRSGSNNDPKNHTGLAHYLEHMLFKGTDKFGTLDWAKEKPLLDKIDALYEKYNHTTDSTVRKEIYKEIDKTSGEASKYSIANEYDKMMTSMGGNNTNAFTSFEQTVYTEEIPSNSIDRFLKLQAERFRKPILRIFHTELEAVYEEKNRGLDNDGWKIYEARNAALFPTHNYGQQTTIGTIEHLKNPSLEEIKKYYYNNYVPNNMAIIMAGDLNSDEIIKKIEKAFGTMQAKPLTPYLSPKEAPLKGENIKEVFGPTPDNLTIAWRWPAAVSIKERVVGTIVDELMSNAKAGLIDINLSQAQKVLKASSSPEWNKDYSVWSMTGTPKTGQTAEQVKDLLMEQLNKLKKGDFDESIIKAIAANYKLNMIKQAESNQGRAYGILEDFIISKSENWNQKTELIDNLAKVTKKEVIDFANKYCGDGYVVIYKRKGTDQNITKVPKPEITPVETNRDKESPFLKSINAIPMTQISPVWLDFSKNIKKTKLGNTELLYIPNTDTDLFKLSYRFDMGNWNSKMLPIALEYLKFLGTEKMSADQINTAFYKLASNFSATSNEHHINLNITGLNENFTQTLDLFENLITKCVANPEALELLKSRMIKQRNDAKLDKRVILNYLNTYGQYGAKNPKTSLNLTNDELNALKAEDLVNFIQQIPNFKHVITYFGPKTESLANAEIAKTHKLPLTFNPNLPQISNFEKITPEKPQVLFTEYDMVQAEMNWTRPIEKFDASQIPIIEVFNNYFGGGMASIVFQTIRESKALAYSTYGYYLTPNDANDKFSMLAYVGTQADKLGDATIAMNELLNVFPAEAKNLDIAKDNLRKTYQTERIVNDDIFNSYFTATDKGLNYDQRQKIYESLNTMTLDDLKNFHAQKIANKAYNYCLVASEKKINLEDLKKYGEVKKLSLTEIFGY